MSKRQIIAMGGGGFSMEPENHLLDDYILNSTGREKPKICFLGTASGDARGYIESFYEFFNKKSCTATHLSLFFGQTPEIESFILSQDILYVGGGNTRNMLVLWKEWGLDKLLLKAYNNGTILCGLSAGSICWFEQGLTDSVPTQLNRLDCLGILSGSNCPHFDGEPERRPAYIKLIQEGTLMNGIAIDDGCALHYIDEKLIRIVSSRQTAKAYSFAKGAKEIKEDVLIPNYLGE
jgi:dipeptidase E